MRHRLSILFAVIVLISAGIIVYFKAPDIFGSVVAPLPEEFKGPIINNAKKFNVDSCFIAAVINGESRWNPGAQSGVGAAGLMQLMPGTADAIAKRAGLPYNHNDRKNPDAAIAMGTALLRYNLDSYGSVRNVLVAYNAGGGRVKLADSALPRETQGYIGKISRYYELYASVYPDFCTGPSLIGKATNPNVTAGPQPTNLPDFVPPPIQASPDLKIENFWKAFLLPSQ